MQGHNQDRHWTAAMEWLKLHHREIQLAGMRGTVAARGTDLDPKMLFDVQPFDDSRASWKGFEFHVARLPHRTRQQVQNTAGAEDPTKEVHNVDLEQVEEELKRPDVFRVRLGHATRERERESGSYGQERQPWRRSRGASAASW